MNLLVKMKFGSHLYGTDTPQSDTDYKGVYMPGLRDIMLGKIKPCYSENTKKDSSKKNEVSDVDFEAYSLHYFIQLACEGETVALDMLHAPQNMILQSSYIWDELQRNRKRFYTKNLKSFVEYARSQAAKYGVKGSRLSDCKRALEFLASHTNSMVLGDVWDQLPTGEHISKGAGNGKVNLYTVCGRSIQSTCKIHQGVTILSKYYENYGARAKLAETNTGIDWKAISHALRAAFQVKEILTTGDLVFPLKDANFLKQVKAGMLSYKKVVGPRLEEEMDELEIITSMSVFPEKVDRSLWDDFIVNAIEDEFYNG